MRTALTIAGSDSSGGAGIQADLKTFSAHGVYGMSVITAITAQNTQGVFGVQDITPDMIGKQIDAIFEDLPVNAVKIGMVSVVETINVIADCIEKYQPKNIVLDPVMVSKSGYDLLQPVAKEALIKRLIPLATIVTPNIPEAEHITNTKITSYDDMKYAAKTILEMGATYALIKGGHLDTDPVDILFDGNEFFYFESKRIQTKNTHGTGCTLSSSIAANLANGLSFEVAIEKSKAYITTAIEHALAIGNGHGPTHHFYDLYKQANLKTV
jgi:hydroxymethylpyrimidine/phosphomethylpyrimidine kinase